MIKLLYIKIWQILSISQRRKLILLFVMILIGMILEMFSVSIFMPLLSSSNNSVIHKFFSNIPIFQGQTNSTLIHLLLFIIFVYLIKGFYQAINAYFQVKYAFNVQKELSQRIFRTYINQKISFFAEKNSSELVNNSISEITIFTFNGLIQSLLLATEFFITIGLVSLLFFIEPRGTIIVIVIQVVLSVIFQKTTQKKVTEWGKSRQNLEQERIKHLIQGFSSIKEIKIHRAEEEFIQIFDKSNKLVSEIGKRQQFVQQLPRIWLEFATIFSIVCLVLYLSKVGLEASAILPILAIFGASAFRLLPSVNRIMSCLHYLTFASSTVDRIYSELTSVDTGRTLSNKDLTLFNEITLNNIYYCYTGSSKYLFKDFSLNIKKNDKVVIVGKSGSGKSTLMDLLLGLQTPTLGSIKIDSFDIQDVANSYYKLVGYVPQQVYILNDSLERNIAFGISESEINRERIFEVIKLAKLEEVLKELGGDVSGIIGENGGNLSGGQCQRIGIARALYNNPRILFFDEATSSLDKSTEVEIMKTIVEISFDKTLIFITHNNENIKYFDSVINLDSI
jgi:ABC-type bacteriocin/lantibiotic exporter with double-glycine peptidase domain